MALDERQTTATPTMTATTMGSSDERIRTGRDQIDLPRIAMWESWPPQRAFAPARAARHV